MDRLFNTGHPMIGIATRGVHFSQKFQSPLFPILGCFFFFPNNLGHFHFKKSYIIGIIDNVKSDYFSKHCAFFINTFPFNDSSKCISNERTMSAFFTLQGSLIHRKTILNNVFMLFVIMINQRKCNLQLRTIMLITPTKFALKALPHIVSTNGFIHIRGNFIRIALWTNKLYKVKDRKVTALTKCSSTNLDHHLLINRIILRSYLLLYRFSRIIIVMTIDEELTKSYSFRICIEEVKGGCSING